MDKLYALLDTPAFPTHYALDISAGVLFSYFVLTALGCYYDPKFGSRNLIDFISILLATVTLAALALCLYALYLE
jgi:hypothetical protein